ncbi:MAG TPA: prolyl oligopeptidase family serine peptidase [Candidatus Limnocylindrales bacterium]|nr:prolyl oligopeptidase family serine peptidase [Candidatus Limnocylindrales bacterium]
MKPIVRIVSVVALFCVALAVAAGTFGAPAHSAHQSQPQKFTIQQVLSAPFPTELIAAPAKNRFAWVFNAEGKRNVWIAEPSGSAGAYSTKQLTNYSQDDGQDVGDLAWAPDAESIAYVHGGDLEFTHASYPNPSRIAAGVEQDVWVVSVNGGEPKKIGEGYSPAVSPKGDVVAYVFKDQLWLAKMDGTDKPEQLIHEEGENSSPVWSPDGQYIAFESSRGDHSFIGIYSVAAKTVSYLDPSTDRDMEPAWSPDSSRVAFLRIATSRGVAFEPKREGPPWSIRVADVASGKGRGVWTAATGEGSVFHEMVATNQILWGDGNRLVFPWERDGWTHLYSVSVDGGTATLMTPGEFEVEYVSLSADRKFVVYSSNQNDIDRRHVWRVAVDSARPEPLTSGTGIETAPVASSDGHTVAVLRSDAHMPMRPAILAHGSEIRDLASDQIPRDFPADQLVTPQQVMISAADGMQIHGQLFLPPNANDGSKHPAAIFFHGGSRREMLLGWHYMMYYSNAYGLNQYLASRGYVVLSVNYRSGIGYGLNFREALNYGAAGASEFNDVLGAGLFLRGRSDVDPHRIGLWGGSYGGYLTALGLARASDLFAAGVDMHGVHDWNVEIRNWNGSYDPSAHSDAARLAWESSPMAAVSTWRSPVLLIQGDDDRNVQFSQMVEMADALRKQGVEYKELVFPNEIHDFLMHKTWVAAYSAAFEFFQDHIGNGAKTAEH